MLASDDGDVFVLDATLEVDELLVLQPIIY